MKTFRCNRGGLALLLVLTLVLTWSGSPALARVCGEMASAPTTAVSLPEASSHCATMARATSCCCSAQGGSTASLGDRSCPDAGRVSHCGCGCSLEVPATPVTSEREPAVLSLLVGAAVLPATAVGVPLPAWVPCEFAAPTTDPPQQGMRLAVPSRAPPVC